MDAAQGRQAKGLGFDTWLATTTAGFAAMITINFIGLIGHFDLL
jgi:hypothetical protein